MSLKYGLLWTLPALAVLTAAFAWVFYDYQSRRDEHIAEHLRFGNALLDALEGAVLKESRGGYYSPEELTSTLGDLQLSLGIPYLALQEEQGALIAAAGRKPEKEDPRLEFEKPFTPLKPRGTGHGRAQQRGVVRLPATSLTLRLVMAGQELDLKLDSDRQRAAIASTAIGLVFLLFGGLLRFRTRTLGLRGELEASQEKLRSLDYLRRLGAGLVHETKNPLGVVRGFAERIIREPLEEQQLRRTAQAILEETDRTTARLDEFLLLSRPAKLRRKRFQLRALFEELATLLDPDLKSSEVRLELGCDSVSLDADREQLRRLFMNLLLNAIQATDPGGRIDVTCHAVRGGLRIIVADTGHGVPEAIRDSIFEPYVSGRHGGTGLGLSIASRIALDHGFGLRYEANLPRGTRMIVEAQES